MYVIDDSRYQVLLEMFTHVLKTANCSQYIVGISFQALGKIKNPKHFVVIHIYSVAKIMTHFV